MKRRTYLAGVLGLGTISGCLGREETETRTSTPVESVTSDVVSAGPGQYPHKIMADNFKDHESVRFHLKIRRADKIVYRKTHTVPPNTTGLNVIAGITVEDLPDPDTLDFVVKRADQTEQISQEINSCFGYVDIAIRENDNLDLSYSIC